MRKSNRRSFKTGHVSCNFIDEVGNRYGKLQVVAREPNSKGGYSVWLCKCDCGRSVTRQATSLRYALKTGVISSCGCPILVKPENQSMREYKRACHLMRNYDMTEDDFNAYWFISRGKCNICARSMTYPLEEKKRSLASCCVDHNHTTGAVRGLLCNGCNKAIGLLQDDPAILRKAIDYLT